MFIRIKNLLLGLIAGISLASCGGGGGGPLAEGGIGGTGISTGTITGFGSVYVNGVKYETSNTTFDMEDRDNSGLTTQDDLEEGMVVTVFGTIDPKGTTGTANTITYSQSVEGPIDGVPGVNSFVVLGRTVIVDSTTAIGNSQSYPADFADTDVVEVSGFIDSSGDLHARYLEKTGDSDFSIHGVVTDTSVMNQFELNGSLIINWTGTPSVSDNDYVEVKGNVYTPGAPGQLTATSVEVKTLGFSVDERDEAELEGISIDTCNPTGSDPLPCRFTLSGQIVEVNTSTEFDTGSQLDIISGSILEVEGSLTGGILIAEEVEFKDEAEVEAQVASVVDNIGTKTITLTGLPGLPVIVNSNPSVTEFDASDYNTIDFPEHLKFSGRMNMSGELIVSRVESGSSPDIELEAVIDTYVQGVSVTVMGVTIPTAGLTFILDDGSVLGQSISSTEFYNYLANNEANIEVKGTLSGVAVTWTEIELDL